MMRECENWGEHLFEPEDALSDSQRQGLAGHLEQCEECAFERELFLESWSELQDAEDDAEPCPFLRAKVWEKIRQEECAPRSFSQRYLGDDGAWKMQALKMTAAAAAIFLGFSLGRSVRPTLPENPRLPKAIAETRESQDFLDSDLIQLASQDGYSLNIFPEETQFSPIDREMMTALATSNESREWLAVDRGVVIPLRYISQGVLTRGVELKRRSPGHP